MVSCKVKPHMQCSLVSLPLACFLHSLHIWWALFTSCSWNIVGFNTDNIHFTPRNKLYFTWNVQVILEVLQHKTNCKPTTLNFNVKWVCQSMELWCTLCIVANSSAYHFNLLVVWTWLTKKCHCVTRKILTKVPEKNCQMVSFNCLVTWCYNYNHSSPLPKMVCMLQFANHYYRHLRLAWVHNFGWECSIPANFSYSFAHSSVFTLMLKDWWICLACRAAIHVDTSRYLCVFEFHVPSSICCEHVVQVLIKI